MFKNILLSLVFIGVFGQNFAQSNDIVLEPNQIAHGNESLDSIKDTMLSHWREKEERFIRVQKNPRDLKQIYLEGDFFNSFPNINRELLKDLANYWVWNFPWSILEEHTQKALIDTQLVNEKGIVPESIGYIIYKNLSVFFMSDPVENDLGASLRENDISSLYENLQENQKAHQATYPVIIENIYKTIEEDFNKHKQMVLLAREKPETIKEISIQAEFLCKLYPQLTQDMICKLVPYFIFNESWSTFDPKYQDILLETKLVDQDGIISKYLLRELFLLINISFARNGVILDTVQKKIILFDHIIQHPEDLHAILISPRLYERSKELGLDHTITKEEMIRLFSIWIVPQLWHQLSVQERQSLVETGYIDKDGIIAHANHNAFLLGFDLILKDDFKDKFPEITGFKAEQVEIVNLQKMVKKAENQ